MMDVGQVMMVVFDILASHLQMQRWHEARMADHRSDMHALQTCKAQLADALSQVAHDADGKHVGQNPSQTSSPSALSVADGANGNHFTNGPGLSGHALVNEPLGMDISADSSMRSASDAKDAGEPHGQLSGETAAAPNGLVADTHISPTRAGAAAKQAAGLAKAVSALARHRRVASAGSRLDKAVLGATPAGSPLANGHARSASLDDLRAQLDVAEGTASTISSPRRTADQLVKLPSEVRPHSRNAGWDWQSLPALSWAAAAP